MRDVPQSERRVHSMTPLSEMGTEGGAQFSDIREGPEVVVELTTRMFRVIWPNREQTAEEVDQDVMAVLAFVDKMRKEWKI